MAAELKQKTIDGVDYGLYKLGAFEAMPVFTKLLKILGPTLLKIIATSLSKSEKNTNSKSVLDTNVSEIFSSLEDKLDSLFEKINEDDFKWLTTKLLKYDLFMVNGKKVASIDNHFNTKGVFHLLKVLKFALEVNFNDFLPESIAN